MTETTSNSNENGVSASPAAAKKKRTADHQLTKDEVDASNKEEEDSSQKEPSGTFQKADEETLKKRRIVTAKRPTESKTSSSSNPFATAALKKSSTETEDKTDKKPVFGSGYSSGFGSVASNGGFGAAASNTASSGFAATPSLGFGAAAASAGTSTTSIFGSSSTAPSLSAFSSTGSVFGGTAASAEEVSTTEAAEATTSSSSPAVQPVVNLPPPEEIPNGEEGETLLMEVRARTFELRTSTTSSREEGTSENPTTAAAPSVPPSSSQPISGTTKNKEEDSTTADDDDKNNTSETSNSEASSNDAPNKSNRDDKSEKNKDAAPAKPTKSWHELGVGPLRLLQSQQGHCRVVQRRENTPGGVGTKLILNVGLHHESKVSLATEKHVRLATLGTDGHAAAYLFKVGNKDAPPLQEMLEDKIAEAESCVKKK